MKKRKWILSVSIVGGVIVLCIVAVFAFGAILSAQGYGISAGRLYFADNGTYLIDSDNMAMRVSDCSKDAELFKGYQNGDKVILFHDGVNETYPAQTGGYYIIRTSKGDGTYKPADEVLGIVSFGDDGHLLAAQPVDFEVQYIRTGTQNYDGPFPAVAVIHSTDELTAYYEENKEQFYLERREDPGTDYTIGFLDACDKYDAKFFENNALVFVVLEEGSGSTSHNVSTVKVDANGIMYINILSIDPDIGTCDMAYWHIMTEVQKDSAPDTTDEVVIYYNDVEMYDGHSHSPANEAQTVDDPVSGYCGNTQTTIYFDNDKSYTFMSGNSVTMTDILVNLKYDKNKLCKCLPEYKVDTEFGIGYGINLTEGYARCDKGQADLTREQIDKLKEIILWAKGEAGVSSVSTNYPNYSFSLTWNTYGISSYDSKTGTLIKTSDATNPKDYTTNLKLTEQQYSAIWKLIKGLDIESYPDEYNPHGDGVSTPYMTLILSVKADGIDKTITVKETMLSYEANNKKGQKFLDTCKGIRDILTATEEWKALPEYEFFYD